LRATVAPDYIKNIEIKNFKTKKNAHQARFFSVVERLLRQ